MEAGYFNIEPNIKNRNHENTITNLYLLPTPTVLFCEKPVTKPRLQGEL